MVERNKISQHVATYSFRQDFDAVNRINMWDEAVGEDCDYYDDEFTA